MEHHVELIHIKHMISFNNISSISFIRNLFASGSNFQWCEFAQVLYKMGSFSCMVQIFFNLPSHKLGVLPNEWPSLFSVHNSHGHIYFTFLPNIRDSQLMHSTHTPMSLTIECLLIAHFIIHFSRVICSLQFFELGQL